MAGCRWGDLPQKLETRSRTRRSSLRRNTDQPRPGRRSLSQRSPSRRSPERLDSSQRSPEWRNPKRRSHERRDSSQRSPERRNSTRRSFEQRSPDRSRRRRRSNPRNSDQLSPDRNNRIRRGTVLQSPVRFDYASLAKTIRLVPAGSPNGGQRSPIGLCNSQNSPDRRSPKWRSPKPRSSEGSSCRRTSGQRTPVQNNLGQRSGHHSPSRRTSSPQGYHPDFDVMRDNMQIFLQRMNLCNFSTVSKDKLAKAEKGLRVWTMLCICDKLHRDPFSSYKL